jgi:putative oxidoreductase
MKIVVLIVRILLGVTFVVFGANGLHPFLPMPPMAAGPAKDYATAMFISHYAVVPFGVQFIGGILLLVNRYVPFALAILGPVIVNILSFHIFMEPSGLPLAFVAAIFWLVLFYHYRRSFAGIFEQKPAV